MATFILNRVRSGSPSARVFSAYLAVVLIIAMAGPGLAVYAAEGQAPKAPGRVVGALPAELAAPVIEPEPVVEPEAPVVPDELTEPEVEPVEKPKAKKSVERPETVTALSVVAAVVPLTTDTGARPICEGGVKLDNSPGSGTYTISSPGVEVTDTTPEDFQIVLTVYDTPQGQVFDFTSNYPVASIGVKGGDSYNDYSYDPPVYSGVGLHAPVNASGYYADISHIIFCFGELQDHESHIIVRKFRDADADGVRDGGEDWLEGFTFRLDRGESETGPWAFAEEVTTVGANGQADFSMYPTGWYRITEVLSADQIAAGETPTTGDPLGVMIFYHTGQVNSEKWFGNAINEPEPEEGDILVYKFEDIDGDGLYDAGEPMLEGWEFTLSDGDADLDSGLTDADGELLFGGLEPGEYTVTETLKDGWENTTPLAQSATVVDGQTAELWFGNKRAEQEPEEGDILVYKFNDLDGDGLYDAGEPMLEDWEFTLTQETPPIAEALGATAIWVVDSGLTDEDGELLFSGLEPGEYTVTETLQAGWESTTGGIAQDATVVAGETTSLWFGNKLTELPPEEGDILVYKFEDLNENGLYDEGEPMLEGWEFTLSDIEVDLDSGLTDADGELLFSGLEPGEYTVTETLQAGWANTTDLAQSATVVDGQTAELWFGNMRVQEEPEEGDILVYKFEDLNENGLYDEGEPMLEGWEFTLSDGEVDLDSGLTDADGELLFGGLEPGEYTVTETLKTGWKNTTPLAQSATVVDGQTASLWFGNIEEFMPFTELDLAIEKAVSKATADPGDELTYTLTYWNNGELAAEDYTIVDDYDERYLEVVDAAGGIVAGGKITWTFPGPLSKEDGKQTITYKMRVKASMPAGTTNVDNDVVIDHPKDADLTNNTDDARVRVVVASEPFLPFTGGEFVLLFGAAAAAATAGALLRRRREHAA